jgi:hypothetical protein
MTWSRRSVLSTSQLPLVHHDRYRCAEDCVYERLLIAQARVEGLMAVWSTNGSAARSIADTSQIRSGAFPGCLEL